MRDIDLIPSDYRHQRWLRSWARKFFLWTSSTGILGILATVTLVYETVTLNEQANRLEEQRAVTTRQRTELDNLTQQQQALTQQLSVLRGLRSGAPAETVFATIDRALANTAVWFVNWDFRRAGVLVPEAQAKAVETGYFIVVPEGQQTDERKAWMVETHMTIRGQAQDHAALSNFVEGLFNQSAVVDVRVQKTALRPRGNTKIVDFDLAVVLNSEARI